MFVSMHSKQIDVPLIQTFLHSFMTRFINAFCVTLFFASDDSFDKNTVEFNYNDFSLCGTMAVASAILWYPLTPHKARVSHAGLSRHTYDYLHRI